MRKLTLLSSFVYLMSGLYLAPIKPAKAFCKGIARVVKSSDPRYKTGQVICSGESITSFSKVVIACTFLNNRFIVKNPKELTECETQNKSLSKNSAKNPARGNEEESAPNIANPVGAFLIPQKSIYIEWLPVVNAANYVLQIESSNGIQKIYKTVNTRLSIEVPQGCQSFSVIIRAKLFDGNSNFNIYSYNVISGDEQDKIKSYFSEIEKTPLSKQERLTLKLSVLGEYGLFQESLNLVKNQINISPKNSGSYVSLGDIYLNVGLVSKAEKSYAFSKQVATWKKDKVGIKLAQDRINLVMAAFVETHKK
jgi:hypothetical protein